VAQEALDEVSALNEQLNFFSPRSEISAINRSAAQHPVPVEPQLFELLCRCREIWELTQGAFDPTIGPLLKAWGWIRRQGRLPKDEEIRQALLKVGMNRVKLDRAARTVRFEREGMSLNLGSVGKGYALDRAREFLGEQGIGSALIHGGTSSVCALGRPPGDSCWRIDLEDPREPGRSLGTLRLVDRCLGVSGNNSQSLQAGGKRYGHVLDPFSGKPADAALLAAVVSGSAADADAFSTALLCRPSQPVWRDEVEDWRVFA
jgi:thiamine biosynthesis lipoprotein